MTDDEKSEQCKEVYAHAGLALYWAQCLEMSLENFLCLHGRVSGECVRLAELDALEGRVEAQTLGRLLRDTRQQVQFEKGAEELLATALERRNFLAHRFFKERAEAFMSRAGRQQMIAELIEIRECFRNADMVATVICKALQKVLGISDEMIEREFKRLVPYEDAEPCAAPNGGPATQRGNSGVTEGPPSVS
jgi:hypothetical protein